MQAFPFDQPLSAKGKAIKNIFAVLFVVYCLLTSASLLFKQYSFLNNSYDTGIEAGAARNAALHGSFFDSVMNMNLLGDHFSPALIIPGLLFRIWDDVSVVFLFQNFCICLSVFLTYRLAKKKLRDTWKALFITTVFAVNYYLMTINTFEFHIEALAIPVILGMFLAMEIGKKSTRITVLIFLGLLCLFIKEDIPIALAVFGLWYAFFKKGRRLEGMVLFIIGTVGFLVIVQILMPYFSGGVSTHASRYSVLGSSTGDIIKNIITRPDKVFFALTHPAEKIGFMLLLFISFLILPFFAPVEALAVLGPVFFHMLSSFYGQYSFTFQYSAAILPFLVFASIQGLFNLDKIRLKGNRIIDYFLQIFGWAAVVLILVFAGISFGRYILFFTTYKPALFTEFSQKVRPLIKPEDKILAVSEIQPMLLYCAYSGSLRNKAPLTNVSRVVLTRNMPNWLNGAPWPWNADEYRGYAAELENHYPAIYKSGHFIILQITN